MKMSDYFELPVSFDIDLCKIHSPSHNLIEAKAINLEAQCYAINNHDRLTEENAKLREFVEIISSAKVYTVEVSNPYGGTDDMDCLCDSLKDKAKHHQNVPA